MMPLGEPARRVVIRAGLGLFLRRTAEELGITIAEARDITQSVLAEEKVDDPHGEDDGSTMVL